MDLINTSIAVGIINKEAADERDKLYQHGKNVAKDVKIKDQDTLINIQNRRIADLERNADAIPVTSGNEIELENRVKELEDVSNLLSKPMLEIAQQNGAFKETYMKQQAMLAEWIISQRAFKELTMQYGQQLGKTPEQVLAETESIKKNVIAGKSEFGNNVDQKVVDDLNYVEKSNKEKEDKSLAEKKRVQEMLEKRRQERIKS